MIYDKRLTNNNNKLKDLEAAAVLVASDASTTTVAVQKDDLVVMVWLIVQEVDGRFLELLVTIEESGQNKQQTELLD